MLIVRQWPERSFRQAGDNRERTLSLWPPVCPDRPLPAWGPPCSLGPRAGSEPPLHGACSQPCGLVPLFLRSPSFLSPAPALCPAPAHLSDCPLAALAGVSECPPLAGLGLMSMLLAPGPPRLSLRTNSTAFLAVGVETWESFSPLRLPACPVHHQAL